MGKRSCPLPSPSFLSLMKEKKAKENQGDDRRQVYRVHTDKRFFLMKERKGHPFTTHAPRAQHLPYPHTTDQDALATCERGGKEIDVAAVSDLQALAQRVGREGEVAHGDVRAGHGA